MESLEEELLDFSRTSPMTLILPCLFSELEGSALAKIVDELAQVKYLDQIIIGLDRASEAQFEYAKKYFARLPQNHKILWNDGYRLQTVHQLLKKERLAPSERGKGYNVWYCMGYFLSCGTSQILALHDCDILTYEKGLLAKLLYPVANPTFEFKFCKGYYYRQANNKLNGRVTRLLVSPLLRSLKKVVRDNTFLDYIDSFRYPLSGEFSMMVDVVNTIRIPYDWGLEVGVLYDVYRNYNLNKICQADIANAYDHKHQDLSLENREQGLSKMSIDICKALFRKMAASGQVFSQEIFRTIKATYYRTALDYIERYHSDAIMNGLTLDRHNEEKAIELFAQSIILAGNAFLQNPHMTPVIPSWNRVMSADSNILQKIYDAVEADNS
ncbi:Glucosyl-3-phosphoglycerate synthase [Hyella patelloides LEGE 07179]|uniref:Glucosyl-3-phosphoglycerate synthase n=1 Tax=Hyella patelloides LEGE 07179 TaxID=945734 RepID=A0A563VQ09_9CYAN|nr:glycosyl transferase [Hyella patelloides]VEP13469.1 Glucosyl-3-phosphoglycerate synthase [Hyella patelloides LEGE 07179]